MVTRVWRVAINIAIKTVLLMAFNLAGLVTLNQATPPHGAGKDWLVAAAFGAFFSGAFMATLEVCFRYAVRTHAGSLLIQPAAGLVVLAAVLWLAPRYIAIPGHSWPKFVVVGLLLVVATLPIRSRKDRQIVVITGAQPPE